METEEKEVKVFAISDTHFFHKNIVEKFGRKGEFKDLDEMHNHIIKQWNSIVGKDDIVIHLGDVAFQTAEKKEEITKIMKKLKGRKMLILGNHDREIYKRKPGYYHDIGFEDIYRDDSQPNLSYQMVIKSFIFSHEPLAIIPEGYRNIHGHVHRGISAELFSQDLRRINVNVELNDYKPYQVMTIE